MLKVKQKTVINAVISLVYKSKVNNSSPFNPRNVDFILDFILIMWPELALFVFYLFIICVENCMTL